MIFVSIINIATPIQKKCQSGKSSQKYFDNMQDDAKAHFFNDSAVVMNICAQFHLLILLLYYVLFFYFFVQTQSKGHCGITAIWPKSAVMSKRREPFYPFTENAPFFLFNSQ